MRSAAKTCSNLKYNFRFSLPAPVAQLDRVAASEAVGHRFESCRVHQFHCLPSGLPATSQAQRRSAARKTRFANACLTLSGVPHPKIKKPLFAACWLQTVSIAELMHSHLEPDEFAETPYHHHREICHAPQLYKLARHPITIGIHSLLHRILDQRV